MAYEPYAFIETPLNFPKFEFTIQEKEGRLAIFDSLRKRYLVLTPEEWVRQHMVSYLIQYEGYPRGLFALEKGLKYNQLQKRFDIMVLDRTGSPFLLVECKAPDVQLGKKTMEQITTYNMQIEAPYLGISNGRQHLFFGKDPNSKSFTQLKSVPQINV